MNPYCNNGDPSRLAAYWSREARAKHPSRCQAVFKGQPDKICCRWALKGSRYCARHGGKLERTHRANNGGSNVRVNHLPRFYSKQLTGTLAEFVRESLDSPAVEQLDLLQELALFRAHAAQAVAQYNMVRAIYDMLPVGTPKELIEQAKQAVWNAGAVMQDMLERVADLTLTASKVRANEAGSVSIHNIVDVSNQFVRIIYEMADEETARRIEHAVKNVVRVAATKQEGTTLTPDQIAQTVRAMDATIPRTPATNGNGNGKH